MDYLVSVIITCYNVEKYLSKCIESVINQTYKNLEIIIIDDGSRDKSGYICDYYEGQDDRIRLVHQNNSGPGNARNVGIEMATGDYIGFVDGDDYIEPDMVERMISGIVQNDCDIAACGVFVENESNNTDGSKSSSKAVNIGSFDGSKDVSVVTYVSKEEDSADKIINKEDMMSFYVNENGSEKGIDLANTVWNKIYKAEIVKNVKFQNRKYYEDIIFAMSVLAKATKAVYIAKPLYHFIADRGDGVIQKGYIREVLIDRLSVHKELLQFLKDNKREDLIFPLKYNFYNKLLDSYDAEKRLKKEANEIYLEELVEEIEKCNEDFYRIYHCDIAQAKARNKMKRFLKHRKIYNIWNMHK